MSRRGDVAMFPPGWGMAPSSVLPPPHAIVLKARFALPRGHPIGPSWPMAQAATPADAAAMSDLRKVLGAAALATLAAGITACGDDGGAKPAAPKAPIATPRADAQDL